MSISAAAIAGLPAFSGNRAARLTVRLGIAGSLIALGLYLALLWNPLGLIRYGDDRVPDPDGGTTVTTWVGTAMAIAMAIAIPIHFRPCEQQQPRRREPAPNRQRWDKPTIKQERRSLHG